MERNESKSKLIQFGMERIGTEWECIKIRNTSMTRNKIKRNILDILYKRNGTNFNGTEWNGIYLIFLNKQNGTNSKDVERNGTERN